MAVMEVPLPPGTTDLNFQRLVSKDLLRETLLRVLGSFPKSATGYCLRFQEVPGGESFFVPCSETGVIPDPKLIEELPPKVPYNRLLQSTWTWPLAAMREKSGGTKCGQLRLSSGNSYFGYFKVCDRDGVADYRKQTFSDRLVDGLCAARTHLSTMLETTYARRLKRSAERIYGRTRREYERLANDDIEAACAHVAAALTSHLGAGLNRAAAFLPVEDNTLKCVYAHGGDASGVWAEFEHYLADHMHSP